ncbi:Nitrate/sulfonate/bicarbonate ABC transporter ATPase (plasmid) [Sodalis praecaptivus]|uniref:Nitrate/sulfonate/bicarbonate ABC transporter ATPase n=1 Tax=Sodalis praecaptivus TaxID=1239307 RepID=W0HZ86_9GAMM|nr:ABC transporter ATP-binding protein [Sodalis praecaptivus]AHF79089.1 Nitrate/sulfonate/bicarbonate ABC transporter ATPase [Sodalis praecaptivus]
MLTVAQLHKVYPSAQGNHEAIRAISFTLHEGEFLSIVGPSGAGKSTLLRAITGLERATRGDVLYQGNAVRSPQADFSIVFQDYRRSLYPWLTLESNITLPLRHRVRSSGERSAIAHDMLARVGLAGMEGRFPGQLSGGQQQRVAIARALACRPRLLILDEPFASVDAQTRFELEDLVLNLKRESGVSVILVTHDIDEATYMSDRVLVLSHAPATVIDEVAVSLPQPRHQLTTRALADFATIRSRLLTQLLVTRTDLYQR